MYYYSIIKRTFIFVIFCACLELGCGGKGNPSVDQGPFTTGNIKSTDSITEITPELVKDVSLKYMDMYQGNDDISINFKLMKAQRFRDQAFDRALLAYWDYNDKLPKSTTPIEIIDELEQLGLIPFWPIDPFSGKKLEIVDASSKVDSWSEIYIEIAENGAFNYTAQFYYGMEPYTPAIETKFYSEFFNGQTEHELHITDFGQNETMQLPQTRNEAFEDMIRVWFRMLAKESFLVYGGKVPENLSELLCGRVIFNERSFGKHCQNLETDQPGNFEFGTDPIENGFYTVSTNGQGKIIERCYRFTKTEVAGELIFDLTEENNYIKREMDCSKFMNRIPLLTDELFSGPIPEF